ncbi:MAG: hypothetical protein RL646_364 [Verrucomicrobiota bacterium]|jgi:hypothetical protein
MRSLLPLLFASALIAADAPKKKPAAPKAPEPPVYLTVETAGPDFPLQGEYADPQSHPEVGANVIALGDGNFRLVLMRGGLPGIGEANGRSKVESEAARQGDRIVFKDATLADGKLTGSLDGKAFTLPRLVRVSPTMGLAAPQGATVLFDGKNADAWENGKVDPRGFLEANTRTKQAFQDFTLHLEFLLPFKPLGRGQGRANSGVYLQHRYEVQVLDSFGLAGLDNECGGIYKNAAPRINMCLPPLQWQTYDVEFKAAKFDADGKKTADAVVSVRHNGVTVHDRLTLKGATPGGGFKTEVPAPGPIYFQGHGNPVVYRNVWVVAK